MTRRELFKRIFAAAMVAPVARTSLPVLPGTVVGDAADLAWSAPAPQGELVMVAWWHDSLASRPPAPPAAPVAWRVGR